MTLDGKMIETICSEVLMMRGGGGGSRRDRKVKRRGQSRSRAGRRAAPG